MIDFFVYNGTDGIIEFNQPEFLLIKEFADLYELERNKCKEDKKGTKRLKAMKEFTYIWLKMNKKSPYSQYSEQEAHIEALRDAGLSQEEFDDPLFRQACRKYLEIRNKDKIGNMLRAAYNKVDDLTDYLDNIIDFNERDASGKPVFKVKDVIGELKQLGDVIQGIKTLELMYEKDQEAKSNLRADAQPGFFD